MNVSLPEPLKKFVERKVAAGEFLSADEVVCEGLRLLQRRETWNAEARHKIDLGWEQAQSGQFSSSEEIVESLAARKEAWKRAQGRSNLTASRRQRRTICSKSGRLLQRIMCQRLTVLRRTFSTVASEPPTGLTLGISGAT